MKTKSHRKGRKEKDSAVCAQCGKPRHRSSLYGEGDKCCDSFGPESTHCQCPSENFLEDTRPPEA
jgi:hypothetical protein